MKQRQQRKLPASKTARIPALEGDAEAPTFRRRILVHSRCGLHARPAAIFVQVANRFKASIWVRKGRRIADGKSILGLLTLAAPRGTPIELIARGVDAEEAVIVLAQILAKAEPPTLVNVRRRIAQAKERPPHTGHGASSDHL